MPAAAATGDLLVSYPNPEPHSKDWFGGSVAAVGDRPLIGASGSNAYATDAGAAYLFPSSGTLPSNTWHGAAAGDGFGYSVAARGNDVLVGALYANGNAGGAYIYDGSTSLEKFPIVNPTPNPSEPGGERFGNCVAAIGNNILVGALWDNPGGAAMCGAVYLYDGTSGALLHTFQPPTIAERQFFGFSVTAVGNNQVLIGAQCDNTHGFDTGAAYLYTFNGSTWNDATPLKIYEPTPHSYFGRSVAALGNDLLISSYSHTYLFDGITGDLKNPFSTNGVEEVVTTLDGNVLITPARSSGPQLYSGIGPYQLLWSGPGSGDTGAALGHDILVGSPSDLDGRGSASLYEGPKRWISPVGGSWDTGANWSKGTAPGANDVVLITPTSTQLVNASVLPTTVAQLIVSAPSGGVVQLQTQSTGQLTVTGHFVIDTSATVRVNGLVNSLTETYNAGELNLATGSILAGGTLTNKGVVAGDGQVASILANNAGAEVRVSYGQRLRFTGASNTNAGRISLLGGTAEFTQDLNNSPTTGFIGGRGILRVAGGLTNYGTMGFSGGFSDVYGAVAVEAGGHTIVSGGGTTTFYDSFDVMDNGELRVSDLSNAVFFGPVHLHSGAQQNGNGHIYFENGLQIGNSPGYQEFNSAVTFNGPSGGMTIQIAGTNPTTPEFSRYNFLGGLTLNNAFLDVEFTGLHSGDPITYVPLVGDSFDFLDWSSLSGYFDPNLISLPSLPSGMSWDMSQIYTTGILNIVPEPSSLVLVTIGAVWLLAWTWRRRR